jgi:hypothetical protein
MGEVAQRKRARMMALVLAVLAAAFYVGFILITGS